MDTVPSLWLVRKSCLSTLRLFINEGHKKDLRRVRVCKQNSLSVLSIEQLINASLLIGSINVIWSQWLLNWWILALFWKSNNSN